MFCIQFTGRRASALDVTAVSPGLTILMRTPPVDDAEPGKFTAIAYVSVPNAVVEVAAPAADATVMD
jgi:hypothetical protein